MNRTTGGIIAGVGCILILLFGVLALAAGTFLVRQVAVLPSTGGEDVPPPTNVVREEPRTEETPRGNLSIDQPLLQAPGTLNELFEQVNPGVVSIQVFVVQNGVQGAGAGSGFILSEDGYIATNYHVVEGAENVTVTFFNDIQAPAEVVGRDINSDLAIIKVESLVPEAYPLPLGDSDNVLVGEQVVALGNPFSLANTMTYGIVSAVGRLIPAPTSGNVQMSFDIPQAIQTDAAINPGNSGGPLINMAGEVIGINAQIQTGGGMGNVGIGFAIPVNILKLVMPSLISEGQYTWPWLGVTGTRVNELIREANGLETQEGAYIVQVVQDGPAAQAGMQGATQETEVNGIPIPIGGDVVIAAEGEPIQDFADLLNIVAFHQPGDTLTLTVLRQGERVDLEVTLEPRPQNQPLFSPEANPFP